jgi:tetratricopeptide (TPR) repeat protein
LFTRGIWHYARGTAFAAKDRMDEAQQELAALQKILADPALQKMPPFSQNSAETILKVAQEVLTGDLAMRRKDFTAAVAIFDRAVRLEDAMVYTEPPDWHAPVRHWLGAALLAAGRASEAETVYWEDLRRNRDNGWSLVGLREALSAQGKKEDAALIDARLKKSWARSDVTLTASRY